MKLEPHQQMTYEKMRELARGAFGDGVVFLPVGNPYMPRFEAFATPTEWGTVQLVNNIEAARYGWPQSRRLHMTIEEYIDLACGIVRGED